MDLSNIRVNTYFGIFQLVLSVVLQPYNSIYPNIPRLCRLWWEGIISTSLPTPQAYIGSWQAGAI